MLGLEEKKISTRGKFKTMPTDSAEFSYSVLSEFPPRQEYDTSATPSTLSRKICASILIYHVDDFLCKRLPSLIGV